MKLKTLDEAALVKYKLFFSELSALEQRRLISEVWCQNNPKACEEADPAGIDAMGAFLSELSGVATRWTAKPAASQDVSGL